MKTPQERELREQWHVRTANMAQEVIDYSKVEGMIADWWVDKLSQALDTQRKEIVEKITELKIPQEKYKLSNIHLCEERNAFIEDILKLIENK